MKFRVCHAGVFFCFVWKLFTGVSAIIAKWSASITFVTRILNSLLNIIYIKDYVFLGKEPLHDVTFLFISADLPDFEVVLI